MSKYPYVILFRYNKYSEIDSFIESNKDSLMCTIHITSSIDDLNKLFNPNYHLLVTYGDSYDEYYNSIADKIPERFSRRWFHKNDISNIAEFNHNVNYCYTSTVINSRENTRPIFSIFTTCFKSYNYINTAFESIKKQSLIDWEWVIMDDTPEDAHFVFLKTILASDNRVRLYKRDKNSGNIGNVKNEAISLCRGKYILEMDHDDEILPDCLQDAYNIFNSDEEIGFVYGDTIHLHRDGTNFNYGDFICKGYGGYYMEKIKGKWVYVYNTPNINNITLSHLVCLPNHPRIWKRTTLMELESYSEFLPICDDYEIILRTCCSKYKVVKNNKAQYIQYMNDGGNNFSNIRNSEINRLGPKYISPMFYQKYGVNDKMRDLNAYEDEKYIVKHSPIWKRGEKYQHKKMNQRINFNYDTQYCIINDAITEKKLVELYKNDRNDFIFLSNRMSHEDLHINLESLGFDRMKCYSFTNCTVDELVNYFKMVYANDNCQHFVLKELSSINDTTDNISHLDKTSSELKQKVNNIKVLNKIVDDNTILKRRCDVLNCVIRERSHTSYLEIGVENGFTFKEISVDNKLGVDPDPIYKGGDIVLKNSDDFFKENNKIFDIIFIDGMHQLEYVHNDFFNAIKCLTQTGSILIDDVLPMNEREQYKIPLKHYYNNGILKYGEPWTGDVWKFIYFLFQHYQFDFSIYNFTKGYRGIIHIYNFKNEIIGDINTVELMNSYDYKKDYDKYLKYIIT
uniref:Glycosyltransferase 2-like domain-containing protein n=1 Tax=viral metagenome TaxID=1070528 RepID=A0A6C0C3B4_9ZZZZ